MPAKKFEFLEHTADIKFRIYGRRLEEIFANCALAVSHILSRGKKIRAVKKKKFVVCGKDYESMIYDFIDELIYLFDAKEFIVSKVKATVKEGQISILAFGDDVSRYKDLDSIKSATYAEMYIKQLKNKKWEAQVVVDV